MNTTKAHHDQQACRNIGHQAAVASAGVAIWIRVPEFEKRDRTCLLVGPRRAGAGMRLW